MGVGVHVDTASSRESILEFVSLSLQRLLFSLLCSLVGDCVLQLVDDCVEVIDRGDTQRRPEGMARME